MKLVKSIQKRALKLKTLLTDPETSQLTEDQLIRLTQRDPNVDHRMDRCRELADFYGLNEEECRRIESIENKQALIDIFENFTTDSGLLGDYQRAQRLYVGRLMLAINRVPAAFRLIKYLNTQFPPAERKRTTVIDYGCGVADYGLSFASQGYQVKLVDIEGGNLDFARWRFAQRNIPVDVLPVTEANLYPRIEKADIVIAGEVLEHVREPMRVIRNMYDALPAGGFFWTSCYPMKENEIRGDHLQEAADVRLECKRFLETRYQPITTFPMPGYLFRKLKP